MGWAQEGAHASAAPGWHAHGLLGARGAASPEPHPPRFEHHAPLATTALGPPVRLGHCDEGPQRHRISHCPTRDAPLGAATSGPGHRPQRDARSLERPAAGAGEGRRCQAHPSPGSGMRASCQHKHGTRQPVRLTGKRWCWPSWARRSQPRGRMWGRRGPSPTSNTLALELASGGRRAWRREHVPGLVPRGMETLGAGASLLVSRESTSAPELRGYGSQNSTAGESIATVPAPLTPVHCRCPGPSSTAPGSRRWAAAPRGRWRGWQRAGRCRRRSQPTLCWPRRSAMFSALVPSRLSSTYGSKYVRRPGLGCSAVSGGSDTRLCRRCQG